MVGQTSGTNIVSLAIYFLLHIFVRRVLEL
jgi:hypothetical protein